MLVLTRKVNETIIIGDDIIVTVVEIIGDRVRLGFEAPAEVPIHRREIYEQIKQSEASQAASGKDTDSGK